MVSLEVFFYILNLWHPENPETVFHWLLNTIILYFYFYYHFSNSQKYNSGASLSLNPTIPTLNLFFFLVVLLLGLLLGSISLGLEV